MLVIPDGWMHNYESITDLRYFNILLIPEQLGLDWRDLKKHPGFNELFDFQLPVSAYKNYFHMDKDTLDVVRTMARELHITLEQKAPGYQFKAMAQLTTLLYFLCQGYVKFLQ